MKISTELEPTQLGTEIDEEEGVRIPLLTHPAQSQTQNNEPAIPQDDAEQEIQIVYENERHLASIPTESDITLKLPNEVLQYILEMVLADQYKYALANKNDFALNMFVQTRENLSQVNRRFRDLLLGNTTPEKNLMKIGLFTIKKTNLLWDNEFTQSQIERRASKEICFHSANIGLLLLALLLLTFDILAAITENPNKTIISILTPLGLLTLGAGIVKTMVECMQNSSSMNSLRNDYSKNTQQLKSIEAQLKNAVADPQQPQELANFADPNDTVIDVDVNEELHDHEPTTIGLGNAGK